MTLLICPKCGSETDASKPTCNFCGKVIIGVEKATTSRSESSDSVLGSYFDKDIDESFLDEPKENEPIRVKREGSTDDDDLFKDLDDLDEFERELDQSRPTQTVSPDQKSSSSDIPKFENPMKKSSLFKKLQEDDELFGKLDEK